MAASTITRDSWVNDTGTPAVPVGDGTLLNNAALQNHIYARIDAMFAGAGAYATFTLGGILAAEGFGTHSFSAGGSGGNTVTVRNTSAGTGNFAGLYIGNDGSATAGQIAHTASTYTAVADVPQDGLTLNTSRAGGIGVSSRHASGTIRFYTGGTAERARLNADGNLLMGSTSVVQSARRIQVVGAGETTTVTDTGVKTATLLVSSTGGSVGDGGGIEFGFGHGAYTQPYFAAIRGLGGSGASNTFGDIGFYLRLAALNVEATEVMRLATLGDGTFKLLVGDTANTFQSAGITINQTTADNEILSFKSSDITHPMTSVTETDTYAFFKKKHATDAGVQAVGLCGGSGQIAFEIGGYANGADGTRSTAGVGAVVINGALNNGAGSIGTLGGNANLLAVRDNGTTRFLLDSDGDSHQDVGTAWTNFDTHDDIALLNGVSAALANKRDPLKRQFGGWLRKHRQELARIRLVTFNRNGHHFVNWSRMHMVEVGAIRQLAREVTALNVRLAQLEAA